MAHATRAESNENPWSVDQAYTNPQVLIGNWFEQRAKQEHEQRSEHQKYILQKQYDALPSIDMCGGINLPELNIKSSQDPQKPKISQNPSGSDDHRATKPKAISANLLPREDRRHSGWENEQGKGELSYPKQVVYGMPQDYGYQIQKKLQWYQEEETYFDWNNERYRNTIYKLSYKPPCRMKPLRRKTANPELCALEKSNSPRGKSRENEIYTNFQTSNQLQERFSRRNGRMKWRQGGVR